MNERIKKLLKFRISFEELTKSKFLYIGFAIFGILALTWDFSVTEKKEMPTEKIELTSVDTLIPEGYVLVPIDIQNYASLDSMIGAFGVVDLFASTSEKGGSRRVAQKVKILRAPLNPSQFAVLIKEENSTEIASFPGAFFVMVQNPNRQGTAFEKKKTRNLIITEDI